MKRRFTVVLYWLVIAALLALFFTNDFGLVDIHKTLIVTAVGIDVEDEEIQVTAQIAVPKPSQSGDNVQYVQVQGSGVTVSDALNEINAKTGFYPKLQFCNLVLLGDSCKEEELFRVLGCFYRKNYSELTADVAMCKGKASEMLAMPASLGDDMNSEALSRVLSDELKKSANVSSSNLKEIAVDNFSVSAACYMPYIEANKQGTSEKGGNGDSVGGEEAGGSSSGQQGGSGGSGGGSGGSEGGEGGGGGSSGQSSSGGGSEGEKVEFTARKTAIFSGGKFVGILDERQSFALDILKNDIRLAVLPCTAEQKHYTVGLKNTDGGVSLKMKEGVPCVTLSFKAKAHVQGVREEVDPEQTARDDLVPAEVLEGARKEIEERMQSLIEILRQTDSDLLGLRQLLHKYHNKYFEGLSADLLPRMQVEYNVQIKSVN